MTQVLQLADESVTAPASAPVPAPARGWALLRRFRPVTWVMIGFVRVWRRCISPLYGDVCKYWPTCSAYGLRALEHHGALRGAPLTVWRILRCNPWSRGGYDPVPGTPEAAAWERECLDQTSPTAVAAGTDHQPRGEQ